MTHNHWKISYCLFQSNSWGFFNSLAITHWYSISLLLFCHWYDASPQMNPSYSSMKKSSFSFYLSSLQFNSSTLLFSISLHSINLSISQIVSLSPPSTFHRTLEFLSFTFMIRPEIIWCYQQGYYSLAWSLAKFYSFCLPSFLPDKLSSIFILEASQASVSCFLFISASPLTKPIKLISLLLPTIISLLYAQVLQWQLKQLYCFELRLWKG